MMPSSNPGFRFIGTPFLRGLPSDAIVETKRVKLVPYRMSDDAYIVELHRLASSSVFDDAESKEKESPLAFKNRIKKEMSTSTLGWICWSKKPEIRLGIVYFSNILPKVSALFHPILDINGYKRYLGNECSVKFKVMDEASLGAIKFMFEGFGMQRITGTFFVNNLPAITLCKRLGFKEEGVIRNGTRVNGKPVDMVIMGLLKEEFK